jgi:muramidase (phage lysozyme)
LNFGSSNPYTGFAPDVQYPMNIRALRYPAAALLLFCFLGAAGARSSSVKDLIGNSASLETAMAEQGLAIPEVSTPTEARQFLPPDNDSPGFDWSTYTPPAGDEQGDPASMGGTKSLPGNIAAFLDVIAYAEGTRDRYNVMFTFATFSSYADHPRQRNCSGKLCSTAAGRYQFLSTTWDPLAKALGLRDFSPLSQDKAVMELIRRSGGYQAVADASNYQSFTAALAKLNRVWASLPGSPYGQPVRSTAALWEKFQQARATYPQ